MWLRAQALETGLEGFTSMWGVLFWRNSHTSLITSLPLQTHMRQRQQIWPEGWENPFLLCKSLLCDLRTIPLLSELQFLNYKMRQLLGDLWVSSGPLRSRWQKGVVEQFKDFRGEIPVRENEGWAEKGWESSQATMQEEKRKGKWKRLRWALNLRKV